MDEKTLMKWVDGDSQGKREMRRVIKRFKRAQRMKPSQKIEGQTMNVFKVWVSKGPVDPRIKAVVEYGGKLSGKKKMKEIRQRNLEILQDRIKNAA